MGGSHPNREILSRFVEGELPSEEARRIDQHLSVCSECRDRTDQISLVNRLEFLDALLNPGYDEAFERAADRAAERLAGLREEGRSTKDQLAELAREPPDLRRRRIAHEEKFHSLKLCELLQARSRESWFSAPAAALEWAELAVVVAQHLDTGRYGSSLVEDARALSWAYVGNAYRIKADLWRAEQSIRQAWFHHLQAGEDVTTETELLKITSALRFWQRRYEEAIRFSDRAIALYREGQQRHAEGVALIQKGMALTSESRFREAIRASRSGLSLIDPGDSHLLLIGKHNLVGCLFKGGFSRTALCLLNDIRPLYHEVGGPLILAQLPWIEGRFLASTGRLGEAKAALLTARDALIEWQNGLEVFRVSLDLAYIYLREGGRRQARELLLDVIPLGDLGERVGVSPQEILLARWFYEQASMH
jgi:tetratricopeptide (TPR) repeat protein